MLFESFVNNVIIDLSCSLNKHTQYKLIWKLSEGCLHQHTVIALYRLDKNGKLLHIFAYPSNNRVFHGLELNL